MIFEKLMSSIKDEAYLRAYQMDYEALMFSKDNQHLYSGKHLARLIKRMKGYDLNRLERIVIDRDFNRIFI